MLFLNRSPRTFRTSWIPSCSEERAEFLMVHLSFNDNHTFQNDSFWMGAWASQLSLHFDSWAPAVDYGDTSSWAPRRFWEHMFQSPCYGSWEHIFLNPWACWLPRGLGQATVLKAVLWQLCSGPPKLGLAPRLGLTLFPPAGVSHHIQKAFWVFPAMHPTQLCWRSVDLRFSRSDPRFSKIPTNI